MSSNRAVQVNKLAAIVREKYKALRRMQADEKELLQSTFKPITTPLKEITNYMNKNVPKPDLNEDDSQTNQPSQTSDDEPLHIQTSYNPYLETYTQDLGNTDQIFGPTFNWETGEWEFGNHTIQFGKDSIKMDSHIFKATPGLYELIFSKEPTQYTLADQKIYKTLLDESGVHKDDRGRLRHQSRTTKYEKIIKPMYLGKRRTQVLHGTAKNVEPDAENTSDIQQQGKRRHISQKEQDAKNMQIQGSKIRHQSHTTKYEKNIKPMYLGKRRRRTQVLHGTAKNVEPDAKNTSDIQQQCKRRYISQKGQDAKDMQIKGSKINRDDVPSRPLETRDRDIANKQVLNELQEIWFQYNKYGDPNMLVKGLKILSKADALTGKEAAEIIEELKYLDIID
ncbi:uncharacterized protein LOC126882149 [Diabrotica virgifera virgifera]|uniref:DUF8207 domain-containing protein n=1 Tax=Diabrotica virgifera virgifera TaxID=50390 RepID=A0ABM5JYD6_DIAVI|nr:uncharacterized protein LOC126882149 [Diabrotica virgifera virgifera]